jgi:putative membrane protein
MTQNNSNPTAKKSSFPKLDIYFKGILMGFANIIPGLSGGTIALIIGIYDRLISCISGFNLYLLYNLISIKNPSWKKNLQASFEKLDLPFLIPLFLGMLTSVFLLSTIVSFIFSNFRSFSNAFFLGILFVSLILLRSEFHPDSPTRILLIMAAFSLSFFLSGNISNIQNSPGVFVIFMAGVMASFAMLLPGLSGAALLYLIGMYEFIVLTFNKLLFSLPVLLTGNYHYLIQPTSTLAIFLSGLIVGIINSAKIVNFSLSTDRKTTMTVLISLMAGSFRFPANEIIDHIPSFSLNSIILILLFFSLGILVPYSFSHFYVSLEQS